MKKDAHDFVACAAYTVALWLGTPPICRVFAQELGRNLRIPVLDDHVTAIARALQVTGIYVCFVQGLDLIGCYCLRDIVQTEGKARLQALLKTSYEDWRELQSI